MQEDWRSRMNSGSAFLEFRPAQDLSCFPWFWEWRPAVATVGSLLSLRKVMRLDPAPVLRGE